MNSTTKLTFHTATALESAKDILREYEAINGTSVYTGNFSRDKEYAALKHIVRAEREKQIAAVKLAR